MFWLLVAAHAYHLNHPAQVLAPKRIKGRQDTAQEHHVLQLPHAAVPASARHDLLYKFAPIIYLHPNDQYLPADPADTFRRYYNATTDSMTLPESAFAGIPLSSGSDANDQLDNSQSNSALHAVINDTSSEEYNDFRRPHSSVKRGRVTAPVTAQSRIITQGSNAGKILMQYWYWHFFNGAQGFAVTSPYGSKRDKNDVTRWEWWPLAIHTADWEHTTITLAPVAGSHFTVNDVLAGRFVINDYELESVYYTVHSEVEDKKDAFPREGTHPVVYSHLNSHAGYATPEDFWNRDPGFDGFINSMVKIISLGRIKQIKVVDIGFDPADAIRWSDYHIYDISDATEGEGPEWALWRGHWGQSVDQTKPMSPPSYVPCRNVLNFMLWLLRSFGKLKRFVKPIKKAPRSGFAHSSWITLDMLPDDWVPAIKQKPSPWAITTFLLTISLAFGSWIVLISAVAILCVLMARVALRRSKKGVKWWSWPKISELPTVRDDEQVTSSLLSGEGNRGHRRGPSEIFETDSVPARNLSWFESIYLRGKKHIHL